MNILNSLTTQQQTALQALTVAYNTQAKASLTTEQFVELVIVNQINAKISTDLSTQAQQITDAASALPLDKQAALIKINQDYLAANA